MLVTRHHGCSAEFSSRLCSRASSKSLKPWGLYPSIKLAKPHLPKSCSMGLQSHKFPGWSILMVFYCWGQAVTVSALFDNSFVANGSSKKRYWPQTPSTLPGVAHGWWYLTLPYGEHGILYYVSEIMDPEKMGITFKFISYSNINKILQSGQIACSVKI